MSKKIDNPIENVSGSTNLMRKSIANQMALKKKADSELEKAKKKLSKLKSKKAIENQKEKIKQLENLKISQNKASDNAIKLIIKSGKKVISSSSGRKIPIVCSDGGSTAQSWKHKVYKHNSRLRPNINQEQGSFGAGILGSNICKAPSSWFKHGGMIKLTRQPKSLKYVSVIKNPFKSSTIKYIAIRMDSDMKPIQGVKIYGFENIGHAKKYASAVQSQIIK